MRASFTFMLLAACIMMRFPNTRSNNPRTASNVSNSLIEVTVPRTWGAMPRPRKDDCSLCGHLDEMQCCANGDHLTRSGLQSTVGFDTKHQPDSARQISSGYVAWPMRAEVYSRYANQRNEQTQNAKRDAAQ